MSIDKTKPNVQIESIANGSTVRSANWTPEWTSSDPVSGIAGHEVRLNNGSWFDVGLATQWTATGLREGTNTLEVRAFDDAGNSNIAVVEFTYERPSGLEDAAIWIAIGVAVIAGAVLAVYLLYQKRT